MSRCKYDVAFRKDCLLEGQDKEYLRNEYAIYMNVKLMSSCEDETSFNCYARASKQIKNSILKHEKLDCGRLLVKSRYNKRKRIEKHVKSLVLSNKALFITLTFNNATLESTTEDQRRRIVQRYLKNCCSHYVANIDYGKKKGREHYHAIVCNDIDLLTWSKVKKYGCINIEHIKCDSNSLVRVSKYINKLTSHALKIHSVDSRLIFSRCTN